MFLHLGLMTHPRVQTFGELIIIQSRFTALLGLEGNICISKEGINCASLMQYIPDIVFAQYDFNNY